MRLATRRGGAPGSPNNLSTTQVEVFAVCAEGEDTYAGGACEDTAGWATTIGGDTCADYVAKGWCCGRGACAGEEQRLGGVNTYPEANCCACGRLGSSQSQVVGGAWREFGEQPLRRCGMAEARLECHQAPWG